MATTQNVAPNALDAALATHFDPATSSVNFLGPRAKLIQLIFGQSISDIEFIGLTGAPNGSVLNVHYEKAQTSTELVPEGIHVDINNSVYFGHPATLVFHAATPTEVGVYVKLVVGNKMPGAPSIGAVMLEKMLRTRDSVSSGVKPVSNFSMLAAGGRQWPPLHGTARWDGFAVWPRYGFDMPLLTSTTSMFPHFPYVPPLAGAGGACAKVSQLLALDSGQKFWDIVGDGWYMHFDAKVGSYSRTTLSNYLAGKYP